MNDPLVSIIIPCYNAEQWIAECIQSALDQTWPNKEVIVIDDGSTDASLAIAQRFASDLVKVITQVNSGAAAARNRGLREAQGDYIQYLDADDLVSPDKIKTQVQLLQCNPPNMLCLSRTAYFYDRHLEGAVIEDSSPHLIDCDDPVNWLITLLGGGGQGGMVTVGAWLTPRKLADKAGNWNESLSVDDDGEYFTRVLLESTGVRYSDSGLYYYRKYKNGFSLSKFKSALCYKSALMALDIKKQNILSRIDNERARRALTRCFMDYAVNAYPDYPEITQLALKRIYELGGTEYVPSLGGTTLHFIRDILGWRTARWASYIYRNCLRKF